MAMSYYEVERIRRVTSNYFFWQGLRCFKIRVPSDFISSLMRSNLSTGCNTRYNQFSLLYATNRTRRKNPLPQKALGSAGYLVYLPS